MPTIEERLTRLELWFARYLEIEAANAGSEFAAFGSAKFSAETKQKELSALSKEVNEVLHLKPEIKV